MTITQNTVLSAVRLTLVELLSFALLILGHYFIALVRFHFVSFI